jgi:hypothetical protein
VFVFSGRLTATIYTYGFFEKKLLDVLVVRGPWNSDSHGYLLFRFALPLYILRIVICVLGIFDSKRITVTLGGFQISVVVQKLKDFSLSLRSGTS